MTPDPGPDRIEEGLKKMRKELAMLHRTNTHRFSTNLTRRQHHLLRQLLGDLNFIIVPSDKNLGPCIIERDVYITKGLKDHLMNKKVYLNLTEQEGLNMEKDAKIIFQEWVDTGINEKAFSTKETTYFKMGNSGIRNYRFAKYETKPKRKTK